MAPALPEDRAPSASLDCGKARAAPTHPRAPPEHLGGLAVASGARLRPAKRGGVRTFTRQAPLVADHALDDLHSFGFSTAQDRTVAGVANVRLVRLTFVGELGFELHIPSAQAATVYAAVREAGARLEAASGLPVRDAGYLAIDRCYLAPTLPPSGLNLILPPTPPISLPGHRQSFR